MPEPLPLQTNAADPDQVKRAGRKVREIDARFLDGLRETLSTPAGRLVFAEVLQRAGLHATVFDHSGSMMYFREGRRNFGLELQAAIVAADEGLADLMEQERRARVRADNRATAAAYIDRAGEDR